MKKKITFTVEEEIINKFKKEAKKNSLNQSDYVEKQLEKYVVKRGVEK